MDLHRTLLLGAFLLAFIPCKAMAISVSATLTVDNNYGLFVGSEDGSGLQFVGRNEIGKKGNPGKYNWSRPETFSFDMNAEDYIYVAAWSDDWKAQGFLGQFNFDSEFIGEQTIYTSADEPWEYISTGHGLLDTSPAPSLGDMVSEISGANWLDVVASLDHGVAPWGFVPGISANADWIWTGSDASTMMPGNSEGEYHIFRIGAPIPEPATSLLIGTALSGLFFRRKKLKNS